MDAPSQGAKDPATATPHVPRIDLHAFGTPRPSIDNMSSPSKKEVKKEVEKETAYIASAKNDFDAKAKEAKSKATSKASTEEGSDLPSFKEALLFDEGMLNSWFQEDKLPIRDRAILLQRMDDCAAVVNLRALRRRNFRPRGVTRGVDNAEPQRFRKPRGVADDSA